MAQPKKKKNALRVCFCCLSRGDVSANTGGQGFLSYVIDIIHVGQNFLS